ncbi:MAG: TM0996/MTH895 family glutaredoxin-like protein [candidate division NC10 bacterium]|nr:TM0996/MTH895 family glutaredoxin-like protein [candidate division NC10 bacterium]
MKIEVLGPGCSRCRATEQNVHQALKQLGLDAQVVHIDDMKEIARRRVMFTPAVFINDQLKVSGRVPKVPEIVTWLATAALEDQVESA